MIEVCSACKTQVQNLPPEGVSYCPECEAIVESATEMIEDK